MSVRQRILIGMLTVSAAAFVGTTSEENYTNDAIIPVKGDVPTYGFGMTHRPDGTPVQLGDRTTPPKALRASLDHMQGDEAKIKQCIKADMYQIEYDTAVKFSYQYGTGNLCNGEIAAQYNVGNYFGACQAYLQYRFVGRGENRYDCSTMVDGKRNTRCWGVWTRQLENYKSCMQGQMTQG